MPHWIQEIYRDREYDQYSELQEYAPQKLTRSDGSSFFLPVEFIEFL